MGIKKYKITLQPLSKFYFGSEQNFGEGNRVNYLGISNRFPSQTSLLGMLRYELLIQDNELQKATFYPLMQGETETEGMETKIGKKSFSFGEPEQDFGAIQKISPVFIYEKNKKAFFHIAPFNFNHHLDNKKTSPILINRKSPDKNYNSKDGLYDGLVDKNGEEQCWDKIFTATSQPGIKKPEERTQQDDDGYYEQQFFKMEKNYAFSFFAEIDDKISLESPVRVSLGGDRSRFLLIAEESDIDYCTLIFSQSDIIKNIFIYSPTYLTKDISNLCDFYITKTSDVRHLISSVEKTRSFSRVTIQEKEGDSLRKSGRVSLLEPGSILYPKPGKETELFEMLDQPQAKKIGYNHFVKNPCE